MHVTVRLFIVVLALVLFMLAGMGVPQPSPRFQFIGWGLFFALLSTVIPI